MISKYKAALMLGVAAVLLALSFAAGWGWNGAIWEAKHESLEGRHEKALAKAHAEARKEEARRDAAMEGARREAQQEIDRVQTNAAVAAADNYRLREAVASRTARASANTCATDGGKTANSTFLLYSQLLDRASSRAAELARVADERRVAGLACERSYDSLRGGQKITANP